MSTEKKKEVTTTPAATQGVTSQYDQAHMSPAQLARVQELSQKAKEAAASGNPDPSYHAEAEAIRSSYGYSGGADGSQYIKLNKPSGGGSSTPTPAASPADSMRSSLDAWLAAAQQQQSNTIDYATQKAVTELERAKEDAELQFKEQRSQIDINEAKAKDNQALYAERRGDKGGIGAAQYDAIMNTAAQNRLAVSQAQQKLATDTARQISDLRVQGEFEKADALLQLSQQYLSQLVSMEQWAAEYGLSVQQFNASLQQWQAEHDLAVSDVTGYYNGAPTLAYQETQRNQLASAGETLLAAGIMPSESQLTALGMTASQAQSYIAAVKLAAAKKGNGGGPQPTEFKTSDAAFKNAQAMYEKGNVNAALELLEATYTGSNLNSALASLLDEYEYKDYMRQKDLEQAGIVTAQKAFDQEANAISSWLQQGMTNNADKRVELLINAGAIGEQEYALLDDLYRRLGYELKVTFE